MPRLRLLHRIMKITHMYQLLTGFLVFYLVSACLILRADAVLYRGEIIGIWTGKKKNKGMEIRITLWNTVPEKQKLQNLAEEYTVFRNTNLSGFDIILTPGSM